MILKRKTSLGPQGQYKNFNSKKSKAKNLAVFPILRYLNNVYRADDSLSYKSGILGNS